MRAKWKRKLRGVQREAEESVAAVAMPLKGTTSGERDSGVHRRGGGRAEEPREMEEDVQQPAMQPQAGICMASHEISVKVGIVIIVGFFGSFPLSYFCGHVADAFSSSHCVLGHSWRSFSPTAGIGLDHQQAHRRPHHFGGGPVVIPLLRGYVVVPGWVSSRDFLLGLAIIQVFPGPHSNCILPP